MIGRLPKSFLIEANKDGELATHGGRLTLCLCFGSLAIFRVGARSSLLLPTKQSLCELRLLTGDGLGATHYLSDCGKHFIARGGESPSRLVEPGAKRHNKE